MVEIAPAATPAAPPSRERSDRFGKELCPDLPFGRAEAAAQADLAAALEDADEHDVGDADGADEQRDGAESEEEAIEGALRVGAGGERSGGLADVDLVRCFGVGGGGENGLERPRSGW